MKTIRLIPTEFELDVWEAGQNATSNMMCDHYGKDWDKYIDIHETDFTTTVICSEGGKYQNGEQRYFCIYTDIPGLIHELNHVCYDFFEDIHVELKGDVQEWHSYLLEYLYKEVIKK